MNSSIRIFACLAIFLMSACSGNFDKVPEDQFVGIWELQGRGMFKDMQVEIARDEKGALKGKLMKLNDNKYIQMFAETGDLWISEIKRSSKYQFRITEKKIARELFGLYGLSSSVEFKAEFIDKNTIGLSTGSADPARSAVVYKRVK